MSRQPCRETADFIVGQETLPAFPAVAPDSPARVGALRTIAHPFRFPHDHGKHRHRPVGRNRGRVEQCKPVADVLPVDVGDLAPGEIRQKLLSEISPVDVEGSRLPDPRIAFEHGFRDRLEDGLFGPERQALAPADRGKHFVGAESRLAGRHRLRIADDLPDPVSAMLALDEVSFPARRQNPNAKAREPRVADIARSLAGPERPDPGLGDSTPGHRVVSGIRTGSEKAGTTDLRLAGAILESADFAINRNLQPGAPLSTTGRSRSRNRPATRLHRLRPAGNPPMMAAHGRACPQSDVFVLDGGVFP